MNELLEQSKPNIFKAPELTKPIGVYDRTPWNAPSGSELANAYTSPSAYKRIQGQREESKPVVNYQKPIDENSPTDGMDALLGLYTSPEEERRKRESSVQRQRIMAVADALRHIGNIYNTSNYAPSQQLNNPVLEERNRYMQEKQLRDANNLKFMSYQQAKANQEARMRQLEFQMQKDARDYELRRRESDARADLNEARIQRQNTLMQLDEARLKGQISKNEYQDLVNKYYPEQAQRKVEEIESRIAKNSRTGGGGGRRGGGSGKQNKKVTSEYEPDVLDSKGKVVKKGKRTTYTEYGNYHPSGIKKTGINWGAKKKSAGIKNWQ
mgnify:CR=1 FL=1